MSRARVHEVSSPISLFPFIGILLCTMGALLVVLVAVSRSARDTAVEQAQTQHQSQADPADAGVQKKLDEVKRYVGSLGSIRGQAERKLHDEHLRLSHVEDHIRRLQEKMRSLQLAAAELEGLEKEHYDDREQAERESNRLNELIDESRKTIASLQDAAAKETASYALVPYEGPNGTFRRPIYIECLKDGVVLQPEGVRISANDLRPPFGTGNPLAATLRASRDHLVRLYPKEAKSRDTEPYPLLLVRPEGLVMFDRARQAIEAGDFDLGFELVEQDWKLKYPQPDPQLAGIEQQALEQARARQEVLAAAAPRAYHNASMSDADDYGFENDGDGIGDGGGDGMGGGGGTAGGGSGSGRYGGGGSGDGDSLAGGSGSYAAGNGYKESSGPSGGGEASGGGNFGPGGSDGVGGSGGPGEGGPALAGGGGQSQSGAASGMGEGSYSGTPGGGGSSGGAGGPTAGGAGGGDSMAGGSGTPTAAASDPNAPPDAAGGQQNMSVMMGSPPPNGSQNSEPGSDSARDYNSSIPADTRGKDWALRQKPQRAVPIRRTIRVVVRNDQLAILPDAATGPNNGKVIPFHGDTVQSLDEFVKQVRDQIDGWGIAGNGLYWRPVIDLSVGAEGQRRANDLARLLKNSGLELRTDETASNVPQGKSNETR